MSTAPVVLSPAPSRPRRSSGGAAILLTRDAGSRRQIFENARIVRLDNAHHLFAVETWGAPGRRSCRVAHWRSRDGRHWDRLGTLAEFSVSGAERPLRALLRGPIPYFDDTEQRWNVFCVALRVREVRVRFRDRVGRAWRAVSEYPARSGIAGPFREAPLEATPDATADAAPRSETKALLRAALASAGTTAPLRGEFERGPDGRVTLRLRMG
jgi:hypothetical protein